VLAMNGRYVGTYDVKLRCSRVNASGSLSVSVAMKSHLLSQKVLVWDRRSDNMRPYAFSSYRGRKTGNYLSREDIEAYGSPGNASRFGNGSILQKAKTVPGSM
jgi:hypothetical protein